MDHKITKFGINKLEAIELIDGLQKLIDGNINNKVYGICSKVRTPGSDIDFHEIFNTLGYDDWIYPIGGEEEYSKYTDKWTDGPGEKRRALCKQMIGLLQKTFKIKEK